MAPTESRRPIKRSAVSDQQKRRDLALLRQEQNRRRAQEHARRLASSAISLPAAGSPDLEVDATQEVGVPSRELSMVEASKLGGREARKLFSQQFMLPEWMIDIPSRLSADW